MKINRILFVCLALCLISGFVYSYTAPDLFKMSTPTKTNSPAVSIDFSFRNLINRAGIDSVWIVNSADSSIVAVVDTTKITNRTSWGDSGTTVNFTLNDLSPITTYDLRLLIDTTAGTDYYSNSDSLTTKKLPITVWDRGLSGVATDSGRLMRSWDSWANFTVPIDRTAFTLYNTNAGASDYDSTAVYTPWDFNNITMMAFGDSVHVTAFVYEGICDLDTFYVSCVDSLLMTNSGAYNFADNINMPVGKHFYIKLRSNAPNGRIGHPTTVYMWLNRSRYTNK